MKFAPGVLNGFGDFALRSRDRKGAFARTMVVWGLLACAPLCAHEPITTKLTWTREISRVIDKHCAGCHHQGGRAMSLTTYADARPWAKAIRDEVLNRRMPPWD